jgi:hypothetical protein
MQKSITDEIPAWARTADRPNISLVIHAADGEIGR